MDAAARRFNPWWLAALAALAASLVLFNSAFPGAGVYLALGIAFIWLINTGGLSLVAGWLRALSKKAGVV